jgi:transposase
MNGLLFIQFLTRLIQRSERKIFLIVDRLSVHEAEEVQVWLYEHRDEIEVFGLPKYSPELNPDEYLNGDLKQEINQDRLPNSRDDLKQRVQRVMNMFANLPQRIAAYFQHPNIQYAGADD